MMTPILTKTYVSSYYLVFHKIICASVLINEVLNKNTVLLSRSEHLKAHILYKIQHSHMKMYKKMFRL